jgi:hypothetical protein
MTWCSVDAEEARTIGARLLRIRLARGKSLRVVARLAGMGKSKLSQTERGEVALDSISDTSRTGHLPAPMILTSMLAC